jgi:hypothetical protein
MDTVRAVMEIHRGSGHFLSSAQTLEIGPMLLLERRRRGHALGWTLVSLLAAAALPGCNRTGGPRTDEIEQVSKLPNKVPVAKFAGHVTVDGQPPSSGDSRLFVILNDPQHLVPGGKTYTGVDAQGDFAFTTYLPQDGAPIGKYIVTFVQFHRAPTGRKSGGGLSLSMAEEFAAPDELKNTYSDPEKNTDNPNFVVEVASPGRTDYDFNLTVAGKEPVKTPGAYAAMRLKTAVVPKL